MWGCVSVLATRTKARAASRDDSSHDARLSAGDASLTGAVVHPVIGLKPTFLSVDAHILRVGKRAAALFHGVVQHVMNRIDQSSAGSKVETGG